MYNPQQIEIIMNTVANSSPVSASFQPTGHESPRDNVCGETPKTRVVPHYKSISEGLAEQVVSLQAEVAALKAKFTFEDYQAFVRSSQRPQSTNTEYLGCGLAGEVGEVVGLIAKARRDGVAGMTRLQECMPKELGDALWFVGALADFHGWTLEDIARGNVDKITGRIARGTLCGHGDNR